ncbi:MrpF/PhaF family protein [Nocardia aobensis]|uniref:MrpF/PhaF family protein n=1 Tax=Nocardia aobensis TaxID=257277 RepID=A0ABW6PAI0_9NOCA
MWTVASIALLAGALPPAIWLSARGIAAHRLVGMQMVGTVTVLVLITISLAAHRPDYLIVATVLALLAFAGTLVFTRLIGAGDD